MAPSAKTAKPGPRPGRAAGSVQANERRLVCNLADKEWVKAQARYDREWAGRPAKRRPRPPRPTVRFLAKLCAEAVAREMSHEFDQPWTFASQNTELLPHLCPPEMMLARGDIARWVGRKFSPATEFVRAARKQRAETRHWRLLRHRHEIEAEDKEIKADLIRHLRRRYAEILSARAPPRSPYDDFGGSDSRNAQPEDVTITGVPCIR